MWLQPELRQRDPYPGSQCAQLDHPIVCRLCSFHSRADILLSKRAKVQSNNLAPALLAGLMPITTEEEPEDADEDAPSRVRLVVSFLIPLLTYP